jgi:hypothetical protein
MLHDPRTPPDENGGTTRSQSQDIACSVWLGQQRRRENGKYRLWGAILKEDRGMSKKHAGGGSHAKNQRQLALAGHQ